MKHNNPTYSLLVVGLLAVILAQQTAMTQTNPPPEGTVNSPGSVLHGRTIRVAEGIRDALRGITSYNQVTNANQLSSITSLNLDGLGYVDIRRLQANDFAGLTNLQTLNLGNNWIANLPSGIFNDLGNLQTLSLEHNPLSSVPSAIFAGLTNLQTLNLSRTSRLNPLPSAVFAGLTNLQTLNLNLRGMTSLPSGIFNDLGNLQTLNIGNNRLNPLPSAIFAGLTNLQTLDISRNPRLSSLPSGIFDGLTNLQTLNIRSNNLVSLPTEIGNLVNLRNLYLSHNPLASIPSGFFDRLTNLQDLRLYNTQLTSLPAGIFDQLTNLKLLTISPSRLTSLPAGIFDQLTNLRDLYIDKNLFYSLPQGIFANFVNLRIGEAGTGNHLWTWKSSSLPPVVDSPRSVLHGRTREVADAILSVMGAGFTQYNQVDRTNQLSGITSLGIQVFSGVGLTSLKAGDFGGLANLQTLYLEHKGLTSLPSGIFNNLPNLRKLGLYTFGLTSLPSGIFDNLPNLETLTIWGSRSITTLPAGLFDNLPNLETLNIWNRSMTTLPAGLFDSLSVDRTRLNINFWHLLPYPSGKITITPASLEATEGTGVRFHVNLVGANTNKYSAPIRLKFFWYESDFPSSLFVDNVKVSSQSPTRSLTFRTYDNRIDNIDQRVRHLTVLSSQVPYKATPLSGFRIDADAYEELKRTNPAPVFLPGEGVDEAGLVWTGTVTITDNDGPPTVSLSTPLTARVIEVAEGEAGITNQVEVPVQLGLVSAQTTSIDYATQDGTATAGQDYTETSGTLTFLAGVTNQTITIPILGDALDEPDERFLVVLSNPTNLVLVPRTVEVKILDDDEPAPPVNVNIGGGGVTPIITPFPSRNGGSTPSSLMFNTKQVSLSESGSATYQVKPTSSRGFENTIVNLETAHSGITVNPSKLMFTPSDWQTYQTVTVTASADAADTNEQASIQHSIPASNGFIAINNAGIVSVTLSHTVVEEEEPETPSEERQEVQQVQVPPTDYDVDDDGLIDVSNLTQLNAIRWDLNGDGQPDKETFAKAYNQAFPSAIANMGIPNNAQAQGYELTTNLHFDSHKNNRADEADPFWNPGNGWQSIGVFANPFQAILEGNGYVISSLFQDQSDAALFYEKPSGLFGAIGNRGQVVNLALEGVHIQGITWVGGLAGLNQGLIRNCSVRGRVAGMNSVGGLVGHNFGHIADSHVHAAVLGNIGVGGLVGWNAGGLIEGSTAPGQEGQEESLGLVGFGTPAR